VLNNIKQNLQSARETQNNDTKIRLARNNLTSLRKFSNNFVGSFENNYISSARGSYYASAVQEVAEICLDDLSEQGLQQNDEYRRVVRNFENLRTTAIINKNLCRNTQ
jgi:hypothetical protein